ncbi:hypothetical protein [Sinorhizobium sp. BG8]|uniref:hypothetical protein n=1 Tax=Sinorhizobium sp. BG8 TaxID=2613773 RepID=UPI00193C985E|nr:hypothetical protein [Sinorhizobium sp. BG8]QRM55167.1 hypothetical protein F3Y30_11940 [Sinorhizobium sp. BG8]
MTDKEGPRPRYRWVKDGPSDTGFHAYDGERGFGRLIQPPNDPSNSWEWNLTCLHGLKKNPTLIVGWYGRAETSRLGAKACEDAYENFMAGKLRGMVPEDIEDVLALERRMKSRREEAE